MSSVAPLWSGLDIINNNRFMEAIENLSSSRSELFKKLFDPRRDIYDECGYPKGYLPPEFFQELFDRNSIGARVCEVMSKECFQKQPKVFESKDTDDKTPFELEWEEIGYGLDGGQSWFRDEDTNPIWRYVLRADILAGIGQYGVMFLGLDDGRQLYEPAETIEEKGSMPKDVSKKDAQGKEIPSTALPILPSAGTTNTNGDYPEYSLKTNASAPKRKILYIRCFSEMQARITQYEANRKSPRFGHPVMYSITMQDPNNYPSGGGVAVGYTPTTLNVHWTRVIHIVDNYHQATSSEISGAQRMRPVLNHILALEKIYGGSGEGYWTSCIPKTVLETHPNLGGDVVVDKADIRNQLENMRNSLQKELILLGMSAKTLSPQMIDPTSFVAVHQGAIAVKMGIPLRILLGSERGQLASGQDDGQHNDGIRGRNNNHTIPNLVAAVVNRCILLKCLTPPKKSFGVYWPDLETQSAREKADILFVRTQSMGQFVSLECDSMMAREDYYVNEMGYDRDEAKLMLENAKKAKEEQMADAEALAQQYGMDAQHPGMEKKETQAPIKVKEGEKLVDPSTGKKPVGQKSQQTNPANDKTNK